MIATGRGPCFLTQRACQRLLERFPQEKPAPPPPAPPRNDKGRDGDAIPAF